MKKYINLILISLLIMFSLNFSYADNKQLTVAYPGDDKQSVPLGKSYDYVDILVKRVVDGDTIKLSNGTRVRLIGIDTPEMHESDKLYRDSRRSQQSIKAIMALGRRSYEFVRNLVEGKYVNIELDVEEYDQYGRLLAYVYLKDGTFVNAKIVEEGFASLLTFPPNIKYTDLFLRL